ncbi:MAG TPA: ATP-binding protein, partial [Candidatus Paceibacterota bacterium]|nr:ATP-binding protein [Candidatus Paceibacterota bacterium]
ANKELEAFTYSVSHDLRAPLRAVNGYARILSQDYASTLDVSGQQVLDIIRSEALRMGQLIDDLLQFSRLGRQTLRIRHTPMTALALEVFTELRGLTPDRTVDFQLASLPDAAADPALIRQVWMNLLDNALKYTQRRDRAEITVSGSIQNHEAVYSVKDNGAGFDMKYADKLFGVFQRLHQMEEFEGNGVGLALVRRLVQRHGGRTWAEAEPDRGATFYFTLPL